MITAAEGNMIISVVWLPLPSVTWSLVLCDCLQAPMYYRKANAAMLVYDITSLESFYDIKDWVKGESDMKTRKMK